LFLIGLNGFGCLFGFGLGWLGLVWFGLVFCLGVQVLS
jgi:hypothetical protein